METRFTHSNGNENPEQLPTLSPVISFGGLVEWLAKKILQQNIMQILQGGQNAFPKREWFRNAGSKMRISAIRTVQMSRDD